MPTRVNNLSILKTYLEGVIKRADHHAEKVNKIVFDLVGYIIYVHNVDKPIEIRSNNNGKTGNILWVYFGEKRYAFSYNHKDGNIDFKSDSSTGDIITKFNNFSTPDEILSIFKNLN